MVIRRGTFDRSDDVVEVLRELVNRVVLLERWRESWMRASERLDSLVVSRGVYPASNDAGRVGSAVKRFDEIHAKAVHVDYLYAKNVTEEGYDPFVIEEYFVAGEAISAGDVVVCRTTDKTVYKGSSAHQTKAVGVAQEDKSSGYIKVKVGGIATVVADEAISIGDIVVISDATAGRVKKQNLVSHVVEEEAAHTHSLTGSTGGPSSTAVVPTSTHTHTNPTTGAPSAYLTSIVRCPDSFITHDSGFLLAASADHVQEPATRDHTHSQGATGGPSATREVASDTHLHEITDQQTSAGSAHTHIVNDHLRGMMVGKAVTAAPGAGSQLDILLTLGG